MMNHMMKPGITYRSSITTRQCGRRRRSSSAESELAQNPLRVLWLLLDSLMKMTMMMVPTMREDQQSSDTPQPVTFPLQPAVNRRCESESTPCGCPSDAGSASCVPAGEKKGLMRREAIDGSLPAALQPLWCGSGSSGGSGGGGISSLTGPPEDTHPKQPASVPTVIHRTLEL